MHRLRFGLIGLVSGLGASSGCAGPACGPGTHDKEGVCVVDELRSDTGLATDSGESEGGSSVEDTGPRDRDGDGVTEDDDCNDLDEHTHPGADELCDGLDNDCDGATDEDAVDGLVRFTDADGDGFGDSLTERVTCLDEGVATGDDCDDGDVEVHPGAVEICDAVDWDCDGTPYADGTATFVHADGRVVDETSTLAGGTVVSPIPYTLSEDGSLNVCGGTFYTAVTVSAETARIWAPGGPESTTLDGGSSAAVTIDNAYAKVELDGLNIETSSYAVDASAVVAGELTLRNSVIEATGTSSLVWGSIWTESDLSIYDTVIRGGGSPRGFWAGGDLIFERSELSEHVRVDSTLYSSSHLGGGGYARGDAWVEDSVIRDNVVVATSTNNLYTSTVLRGGGLATYGNLTMINSVVENNLLDGYAYGQGTTVEGVGLWAAADISLIDSRVEGNVGRAELDCVYSYCSTVVRGAGVYAGYWGGRELSIAGSTVSGNSLSTVFNGTSISGSDTLVEAGGGLYSWLSVDCSDDSVIESNDALDGGGVYFAGTTLSSAGCNWGSGSTDNIGGDIRGSASGDYGSAATFVCEDGTCG